MDSTVIVREEAYVGKWWGVALRGVLAIIIGALLMIQTGDTAALLIKFFGLFAMLDGILVGAAAIIARTELDNWLKDLLQGVVGFAIGLIIFMAPGLAAGTVLLLVALWALVMGVLQLYAAWRIRKETEMEWVLVITGLISLFIGVLLLMNPAGVAGLILKIVGFFLVITGIGGAVFGFKLKGMQ